MREIGQHMEKEERVGSYRRGESNSGLASHWRHDYNGIEKRNWKMNEIEEGYRSTL